MTMLQPQAYSDDGGGEWTLIAMHDPVGRRGVWMRARSTTFEICSGREGKDNYVCLKLGEPFTDKQLFELVAIAETGRWVVELMAQHWARVAGYENADQVPTRAPTKEGEETP